jgi:conjugal transfer/entry exclusion protein
MNNCENCSELRTALFQAQQALRRTQEVIDDIEGLSADGDSPTVILGQIDERLREYRAEAASDTPQTIKAHSKSEYKRLVVQAEGKNVVVEPPEAAASDKEK